MFYGLNRLDVKTINTFIAIVECQGVTAAQARLHLSPSVISGHLKHMEEELGMPLCHRGRAGFGLTEQGRAVYAACLGLQEATHDFHKQMRKIQQAQSHRGGLLRLSMADHAPETVATALQDMMASSYQRQAHIHFSLKIQSPESMAESITANHIDIGVGYFHKFPSLLTFVPAFEEKQVLCCGSRHSLFAVPEAELDIEQMRLNFDWVKRGYSVAYHNLGVHPDRLTATAYHMEATAYLILAGHHLGYLPYDMAMRYVNAGQMRLIATDVTSYTVQHYWAYKGQLSPIAEEFIEEMQQRI